MIMYDHKIFEDMPNNTKNDTCVIFSIITVNLHNTIKSYEFSSIMKIKIKVILFQY